jgi:peptidoglycan hydrolase-like protein with peptidoglycan-binding domain
MWCLTYRPGVRTLAGYSPEQSGWIRVLCARKATPAVVRHVQRRLKAWRCYEGKITGHLDARTRNSVMRFQARRRIHHGGYLSQTTLTTLEKTAPPPTFAYAASPPPCATQACPAPPLLPGTALSPTPPTSKPYLTWPGKSLY